MIKLYVASRLRNVGLSICKDYVSSNLTVPVLHWIGTRLVTYLAWKASVPRGLEGSNPFLSVLKKVFVSETLVDIITI